MTIRPVLSTLLAFSVGLQAARADLTVTQKVEGLGQHAENTSRFKDGRIRVDTSPGSSLIMNLKTGETLSLNHPQKTYLKISGDLAQAAIESIQQAQAAHPDTRSPLTATGKQETINGFPAQEYTCTVADVKLALWLTKDLPDYQAALRELSAGFKAGPLAAVMQSYGFDMSTLPGFPIRTVLEQPPGQTMTRTVVALSAKPLAEEDFQVPAGYTEMTTKILTPPAAARGLPAASPLPTAQP